MRHRPSDSANVTSSGLGRIAIACVLTLLPLVGCSGGDRPTLGLVTGTVRVDGEPTADLVVRFYPTGMRSSTGYTNDRGEYELAYIRDVMGAAIGEHEVTIEPVAGEGRRQRASIPPRYNLQTELRATVESGRNTLDFDLVSE
ncbi:MAG: hypothetical protein AAFV43_12080 [Planctomycetota bacterium]